jgi:hypothetical protein
MRAKRLTVAERKQVFAALVAAQDAGESVAQSVQHVAQHFDITEAQVRQIEQEGIDREWPPLDEAETVQSVGE